MKLIPITTKDLPPLDRALPFPLLDAAGRLLVGAGARVTDDRLREVLLSTPLFAEEHHCADWQRRLNDAMDRRLRAGAPLKEVVAARPESAPSGLAARSQSTGDAWFELRSRLDATLREVRADTDWRSRLQELHARSRALMDKRFDESLYHLVYEGVHFTEHYSARHALMTQVVAERVARMLGWPKNEVDSLGLAALTMNVSMLRLQDQLARSHGALLPAQRQEIDTHAARSAMQLADAGLDDPLAIEVVRHHHDESKDKEPLASQGPVGRLARLLRRVDIFGAKINRRAARPGMSPLMAARGACLGPTGTPDEIGSALLRSVGMYPPGSFVELASGEIGIVVSRGRRANLPLVAALIAPNGDVYSKPALRDTLDQRHAVKGAVKPDRVKVRIAHDKVLAMAAAKSRLH